MSDNVEVGRYFTAPDGLRVASKVPVYPETERYLKNIRKDVDHADLKIQNYARLLEANTIQLIAVAITIEVFAEISPNNLDIEVKHLNYMRDAIVRTWNLRAERLARIEREQGEFK